MNNQIQLVLKSSTNELSLNDHELGIYLVPELDGLTGLPEIRTTSGVNSGYDGGWTSAQHYDARSITIRGVIANTDVATVERLRKQLVSLAGQGKQEELTLDLVTEAGNAYTLQVRTIALEMAMKGVLEKQEFMLQLRADDPLIYDNAESTHDAYIQVSKATGGFTIDFNLPLAITGGSEETVISNDGLEQVPTITRLYGELHNPKIINQTTNQSMQINADLGFSEGQWVDASEVVTGKTINIEDAPDNAPLSSFRLDGETSQQTYGGQNLYNVADMNTVSPGVTIDSEGWITVQHTATGSEVYLNFRSNPLAVQASTNYAIVTEVKNISGAGGLNITSFPSNPQQFNSRVGYGFSALAAGAVKVDISTTKSNVTAEYGLRGYCYFNGTQSGSVTFRTSVMPNTSVTPQTFTYEPYVGGIPAPNPDYPQAVQTVTGENVVKISDGQGNEQSYEVNLGKNLFDKDASQYLYGYFDGSTPQITAASSTGRNGVVYLPCKPSTTYTIGAQSITADIRAISTTATTPEVGTAVPRELGSGFNAVTITTPSNARYIVIRYRANSGLTIADTISSFMASLQVEKGSQATSYSAYFEPIELCKIGTYQDYIYKSDGKWYVHKATEKIIFDGTENWTYDEPFSGIRRFISPAISGALNTASRTDIYSNYFRYGSSGHDLGIGFLFGAKAYLYYGDTNTTVDAFKTWLSSHNTDFYYRLATATDTEITNEALVAQLDTLLNTARTYAGVNNIFTITPNEQGTLEISYYTHKTADNRDEIVIDSRLRTVTLNGLDIYHLIETGSEFLMLAPGENKLSLQSDITGDNGYAEVSYKQGYLSI